MRLPGESYELGCSDLPALSSLWFFINSASSKFPEMMATFRNQEKKKDELIINSISMHNCTDWLIHLALGVNLLASCVSFFSPQKLMKLTHYYNPCSQIQGRNRCYRKLINTFCPIWTVNSRVLWYNDMYWLFLSLWKIILPFDTLILN